MFRKKKDPERTFKNVVSLGKTCQPALHLRRNKLRVASYPFDWIWSPADSICNLVRTDFDGFFDKSNLNIKCVTGMNTLEVHDKSLGVIFAHEFKSHETFDADHEVWDARYKRRIQRFYDVLNSEEPVLFIRFRTNPEDAEKLATMLSTDYPRLPYTLLALDDTDVMREDWKIPNVINRHIAAAPERDAGSRKYNPAWKKLFKEFYFDLPKTASRK